MKVFLDDERDTPQGWIRTCTPEETIHILSKHSVKMISLDHDLGENIGTGYDVLLWIENKVFTENYKSPEIIIHTSNPSARRKMELTVQKIKSY